MGHIWHKFAISFVVLIAYTTSAFAQTDPVQLLLDTVGLDLANPDAVRTRDTAFRSNDPRVTARIYKLSNGIKVKLIGQDFDEASDIDRMRIVYNDDVIAFEKAEALLIQNYGKPASKRPRLNVWRMDNPNRSSRQAAQVKIITIDKDNERWVITADRQKGGIGNNPRSRHQNTIAQPQRLAIVNQRNAERD